MTLRRIATAAAFSLSALLSLPSFAAGIPATIASFSQPNLSSDAAYRALASNLARAPGAPFDVKLLILGELGSDEQHFTALRRGRVQIVGVGYQSISTAVPELAVVNAPFLFESWDELDFVLDNFAVPFIDNLLDAKGIRALRHYGMVWHGIYGRKPLIEPADAAKLRYRATIDTGSQLMAEELKADMIQVSGTEILTGLQTGLLDAGETNELVYVMTAIDTEARHWTYTRHTASIVGIIADKKWYERLTPDQKAAVDNGYPDIGRARAAIRADGLRELARAAARGAIVHELSPQARARWVTATRPVHRRLIDDTGGQAQKLYDLIVEGKRAFAAQKN